MHNNINILLKIVEKLLLNPALEFSYFSVDSPNDLA